MPVGSKILVVGLGLWLLPAWAAAQENVTTEMQSEVAAVKEKVETFFGKLTGAMPDPENAVRSLIAGGPLQDPVRTDDVKKLIDQAQSLDARVGPHKGHDWASSRNVGSDLIFLRYLYKGERYPVVWYFTFYRTAGAAGLKGDWKLISLRFDTKVETLDR
jgi:hypothetical protein